MSAALNEGFLESKLGELEAVRPWSPRVVSRLEALIRSEDPFSLFRINPVQFATERGLGAPEAIDLFLHATKLGLFRLEWRLTCPSCSDTIQSLASLSLVNARCRCDMCQLDIDAQLDDLIQVSFSLTPAVRELPFHHPEQLPIADYFFRYRFDREARTVQGPSEVESLQRLTAHLCWLEAGGVARFEVRAEGAACVGHDLISGRSFAIPINGAAGGAQRATARLTAEGFEVAPGSVGPGTVAFEVTNASGKRAALGLLLMPAEMPHDPVILPPRLTGSRLLSSQTFRTLFNADVIKASTGIGVRDLTVLFTDLKGSTAMYERVGDLRAFALVQQHFAHLASAVKQSNGAIVKTIGDAVMASFERPADAVTAALRMLAEIKTFNQGEGEQEIILKVGIHRGPSIVVTLNDRLDYFGQTVNIAARVQGLADAEEICVTPEVLDQPGVKELLQHRTVQPELASLKGIERPMSIYRVRAAAS